MGKRKVFRAAHWLLLLAACLCGAMVFAPIAYSSNFRTNVYAEVYGSWVWVEHTVEDGPGKTESIPFYQDFFVAVYTLLSAACALFMFYILFFGGDNVHRTRKLVYANGFLFIQIAWALALYFHAVDFVGEASGEHLVSGFQREFSLHFFILIFTWAAKRRYRKAAELEFAAAT